MPLDRMSDGRNHPANSVLHPAFGGRVRFTAEARPQPDDDETSTAQTIGRMIQYASEDAAHPIIRRAAFEATRGVARDPRQEAAAVHQWIRDRVRFVEDQELAWFRAVPEDAEVLIRPIDLLTMPQPQGDCDDFSMLAAAMCRALGIRTAYKTIEADEEAPGRYSHVYVVAYAPCPIALDASHGPQIGWEAQATGKTRLWPLQGATSMVRGLGIEPSAPPVYQPTQVNNWWSLLSAGINTAGNIFTARYAKPELDQGEYMRTAQGEFTKGPAGVPYPGSGTNGSLLLIGALGIVLVVALSGRKS